MLELKDRPKMLSRTNRKGVYRMEETPGVKEIERMLGFDRVQPIQLTPSDAVDMQEKDQELRDWYEYELKKFFEAGTTR